VASVDIVAMATLMSHQTARRGPAAIGATVENSDREIAGLKLFRGGFAQEGLTSPAAAIPTIGERADEG
jgi:hypothetical protein